LIGEKMNQSASRMKKVLFLLFVVINFACQKMPKPAEDLFEFHGSTMGTTYTVKIVKTSTSNEELLKAEVDKTLKKVNKLMSTYDPESELSRFNRSEGQSWYPVSAETKRVLEVALMVGQQSGGALDITVGPLVNLWGFGPVKRKESVPSAKELAAAMEMVGLSQLKLKADPPAVWKEKKGIYCDLSAVAKGYGVNAVAERLASLGVTSYMVEVGGEVRAAGLRPDGQRWRIGVAVPDGSQQVSRVIEIGDMSMATSGDYQNYFEKDGKRYSHTIDPIRGRPIEHTLASVTVLHPDCAIADAWATALNVLGPDKGMALAEEMKLAVLFIVRESAGFVERQSCAMANYIKE